MNKQQIKSKQFHSKCAKSENNSTKINIPIMKFMVIFFEMNDKGTTFRTFAWTEAAKWFINV